MTDRRRNAFVLLIVAGLLAASRRRRSPTKTDAPRPRPQGRRRARLPGASRRRQSKVDTESLEPRDRHHAQARRPARRRPAGNPALGRRRNRRRAAERRATRARAEDEVGKTAQLYFYDWEPNVIGPDGKPAPTEATVTGGRRSAGLLDSPGCPSTRPCCAPPNARRSCARTTRPGAPGCTPATGQRLHLRQLVSARHQARKGAARPRGNRTEPLRRRLQTAAGRDAEGGARQPRHRARAGPPGRKRRRQGHATPRRTAGTCSTTTRCSNGTDITNPQQSFDEGAGGQGAERDLRLHLARQERLRTGHQGNRPPRPGSAAAGRHQGSGASSTSRSCSTAS